MLLLTLDNATNNGIMVARLTVLENSFIGRVYQVRCFAHVINLVAMTVLCQFDSGCKRDSAACDENDVDRAVKLLGELAVELDLEGVRDGKEVEVKDDINGWINEQEDLSEEERKELWESMLSVKLMLAKLQKLSFSIIHSSTKVLPLWRRLLKSLKLVVRNMPRDIATRWNSMFTMLSFALKYQKVVDKLTGDREADLWNLKVDDDEWELVQQLHNVLQIFHDATTFVSREDSPALPTVIPTMDLMDEVLTDTSLNEKYAPSIHVACAMGKKTLNRYYDKTDDLNAYHIAMILHPEHKLEYFKTAKWQPEWIKTAKTVLRDEYERRFTKYDREAAELAIVETGVPQPVTSQNMFDNIPALQ
ncbi:hypothetical protein PsYK624_164290 [Phanerochaete sordida]|uniref:hAT-like transposase RNase-H fold domain-containing protein n=1 Tax=Phanerochaete sordida TaxID=48140 RepID=A0A9P3LN00_9APHY|nr:hypothetical protein PsYK624_164290 [Phanerochaete sordida]